MQFNSASIGAGVLVFIAMLVSNSAGFSGMELTIPAVKILFNYRHSYAVDLCQPIALFAIFLRFSYFSYEKTMYNSQRYRIDVRFALTLFPLIMVGCTLGQELRYVASDLVVTTVFLFILLWIWYKWMYSLHKIFLKDYSDQEIEYNNELYIDGDEILANSGEIPNRGKHLFLI